MNDSQYLNLLNKLRDIELEKIEKEKIEGVPYTEFLALMNISYEFHEKWKEDEIINAWIDYRVNLQLGNIYHENPYAFSGWDKIIGIEHMEEILQNGGAFLTWHYGDYRHIFVPIKNQLKLLNKKMYLIVDEESYIHNKKLKKWEFLREESNVYMLNSQDVSSGLYLYKELCRGNCFNLFLDGQTGYGKDNYYLTTKLLRSTVQVRSGVFRIMALANKPISLVIATRDSSENNILIFHKPIYIKREDIDSINQQFHNIFEQYLIKRAGLWRLWFRHHKYIVATPREPSPPISDLVWFLKEDPNVKLCLSNGQLYKVLV